MAIRIRYSPGTEERTALRDDLAALGRLRQDAAWLEMVIADLSEADLEADFCDWRIPEVLPDEEGRPVTGTWGHLRVESTYVLMLWRYSPPKQERDLGVPVEILVDGVGQEREILRRFRELAAERGELDEEDTGGGGA